MKSYRSRQHRHTEYTNVYLVPAGTFSLTIRNLLLLLRLPSDNVQHELHADRSYVNKPRRKKKTVKGSKKQRKPMQVYVPLFCT